MTPMSTRRLLALPLLAALACSTGEPPPESIGQPATPDPLPAWNGHTECEFSPAGTDIRVRFDRMTWPDATVTDQAEVVIGGDLFGSHAIAGCPKACPPVEVEPVPGKNGLFTVSLGAELKVVRSSPAGTWSSPAAVSCHPGWGQPK
jgi:hypothetical protein